MQTSKGYSLSSKPRWRNKSGYIKNVNQQGALTLWRAQMERQVSTQEECGPARETHQLENPEERQVRTWKECEPVRGTHSLESPDRETSQNMERMPARKGHSLSEEPRQSDKLGHGMNEGQQAAPTNWKAQMEAQVSTPNASKRLMGVQEKK